MFNPDGTKTCPRCGESKSPAAFYSVNRPTGDGLSGYCVPCLKAKAIEWQKANPGKKRASNRKQAAKPGNREKMRERLARWTMENPKRAEEARRAASARWHAVHPEYVRAWQAAHPERVRAAAEKHRGTDRAQETRRAWRVRRTPLRVQVENANQRARRKLRVEEWAGVLAAFANACAYCGRSDEKLDIDHLVPVSVGGVNAVGNIVPACRSCNASKRARPLAEFCAARGLDEQALRARAALDTASAA